MLLDLNNDEKMLIDAVSRFAEQELAPAMPDYLQRHEFPAPMVRAFGELGYLGTAYDPDYSGAGLGVRGAALVAEILARTEPSFA
ncbi:acyl-CoA dehydrogenase family protein, partial [Marinobacter sp.]